MTELIIAAPRKGSRIEDGATFLCMGCLGEFAAKGADGYREFIRDGTGWLNCKPCRARAIRERAVRDGRISYCVTCDVRGAPLYVGDWGGVDRYTFEELEPHAGKGGKIYWRFTFKGADGALWRGTFHISEGRLKRGFATFAKCARVKAHG